MSQAQSYTPPIVPYTALLGGVIAQRRKQLELPQSELARHLRLSPSAYSRIESGGSAMSVTQLRQVAEFLQTDAQQLLNHADFIAAQLAAQGAQIIHEKGDRSAGILIGLGLLAAALMAAGSSTK